MNKTRRYPDLPVKFTAIIAALTIAFVLFILLYGLTCGERIDWPLLIGLISCPPMRL